jgi:uncharacterized membrane protein
MHDLQPEQHIPSDEELERTTIAPTMVAYGVAFLGLLTAFGALSSEHLYIGAISIIVAVAAVALGTLWLVNRTVHYRHVEEHDPRRS